MIWRRNTPQPAPVPAPSTIIDSFIDDMEAQRVYHSNEVERLQAIINDAQARLINHRIAQDALANMLKPISGVVLDFEELRLCDA